MKTTFLKTLLAGAGTILVLNGCVVREKVYVQQPPATATVVTPVGPNEVIVTSAPPPPRVETVPRQPGPSYVWVEGSWVWSGSRWTWNRGHWVRPPRSGVVWYSPHYTYRNGAHIYVRGHWH